MRRFALFGIVMMLVIAANLWRAPTLFASARSPYMCDLFCQETGVPPAGMSGLDWQNYQLLSSLGYAQPLPGQMSWISPMAVSQRINPYAYNSPWEYFGPRPGAGVLMMPPYGHGGFSGSAF